MAGTELESAEVPFIVRLARWLYENFRQYMVPVAIGIVVLYLVPRPPPTTVLSGQEALNEQQLAIAETLLLHNERSEAHLFHQDDLLVQILERLHELESTNSVVNSQLVDLLNSGETADLVVTGPTGTTSEPIGEDFQPPLPFAGAEIPVLELTRIPVPAQTNWFYRWVLPVIVVLIALFVTQVGLTKLARYPLTVPAFMTVPQRSRHFSFPNWASPLADFLAAAAAALCLASVLSLAWSLPWIRLNDSQPSPREFRHALELVQFAAIWGVFVILGILISRWMVWVIPAFFTLAGLFFWGGEFPFAETDEFPILSVPLPLTIAFLAFLVVAGASFAGLGELAESRGTPFVLLIIAVASITVSALALNADTAIADSTFRQPAIGITEAALSDLQAHEEAHAESRLLQALLANSRFIDVYTNDGFIRHIPPGTSIFDPGFDISEIEFATLFRSSRRATWQPDDPTSAAESRLSLRHTSDEVRAQEFEDFPAVDPVLLITTTVEEIGSTQDLRNDDRLFVSLSVEEGRILDATFSDRRSTDEVAADASTVEDLLSQSDDRFQLNLIFQLLLVAGLLSLALTAISYAAAALPQQASAEES